MKSLRSDEYSGEDIIYQVLSWTKVTSLFRFKSVCKSWRSIISKPQFMEAHHSNSLENPSLLIITAKIDIDWERHYNPFAMTIFYSDASHVSLPLPRLFQASKFVSSCNGIVCVTDGIGDNIYLFNPLIRMSKSLPRLVLNNSGQPFKVDVMFAFHCGSRDFKVLRIKYLKEEGDSQLVRVSLVELYSSNADSWRQIGVSFMLPSFVSHPFCPVLISGPVLHDVLYLEGANEIVTFDLHCELFGIIRFPDFMKSRKSNVLDVDGSVAIVVESVGDGLVCRELSLWTMDTALDEVFWKKTFVFDTSLDMDWVFLHLGAKQFFGITKLGAVLYDHGKKETTYIALPSQSFLTRVLKHAESFISIEGFERVEENWM